MHAATARVIVTCSVRAFNLGTALRLLHACASSKRRFSFEAYSALSGSLKNPNLVWKPEYPVTHYYRVAQPVPAVLDNIYRIPSHAIVFDNNPHVGSVRNCNLGFGRLGGFGFPCLLFYEVLSEPRGFALRLAPGFRDGGVIKWGDEGISAHPNVEGINACGAKYAEWPGSYRRGVKERP